MNYRPRCQHCKSPGSKETPFLMVTLDADWASEHNLDPKRTSRVGFVCKSCGETFPAVTYRHEAPAGVVCNVLDRDVVWAQATTWFAMIERPAPALAS